MSKKQAVNRVTFSLLGFQPGMKVRITDAARSSITPDAQGKTTTLKRKYELSYAGHAAWYINDHGAIWLREDCMEPVWDEKSKPKKKRKRALSA